MPVTVGVKRQRNASTAPATRNTMNYDEIAEECESLHYRDKLRLAQLLVQLARKEEEIQHPEKRTNNSLSTQQAPPNPEDTSDTLAYVAARIIKLRPTKKKSLTNSVKAMFQFQGGISDQEIEQIIRKLQKSQTIGIDQNNHVTYG